MRPNKMNKNGGKSRVSSNSPDKQLTTLQDMFNGKVEPDVVHMVFTETGNDFDKSLEQLLVISGQPVMTGPPTNKDPPKLTMAEIAKQMSGRSIEWKNQIGTLVCDKKMNASTPLPAKPVVKIPDKVTKVLNEHKHVMILMRGVPGSGKSTLADQIVKKHSCNLKTAIKLSADDFFRRNGTYNFNPSLLPAAHEWTRQRAEVACRDKLPLIVIDNTNVQAWEMEPYAAMAVKYKFWFIIIEPETEWKYDAAKCAKLNTHGVPYETIQRMLDNFEKIKSSAIMNKYLPIEIKQKGSKEPDPTNNTEVKKIPEHILPQGLIGATCKDYDKMKETDSQESRTMSSSLINYANRTRLNHIFGGIQSWEFPDYPTDPAPSFEIISRTNVVIYKNICAQTTMRDFAILEARQSGSDIIDTSDDESLDEEFCFEVEIPPDEKITLDKGTDIPTFAIETFEEMIEELKIEFPNLPITCLTEILKNCCNDKEWATHVLESLDPEHFDDFSWLPREVLDVATGSSSPSDKSWEDVGNNSSLPFTMDMGFALDLQEEFGVIEGPSLDVLKFELDKDICALIYDSWKKAVFEKLKPPEPSTQKTQEIAGPTGQFEEIVHLEEALAQSLKGTENDEISNNRKILHQSYPGIAQELLESVYAANEFNLDDTLEQLQIDEEAKKLFTRREINDVRTRLISKPLKQVVPDSQSYKSPLMSASEEKDIRKKIKDLYNKQLDYSKRARECVSLKKYAVASYYSEEAFKCQRLATVMITNSMTCRGNDSLDLHELRVNDALCALNEFIRAKRSQLETSKLQRMTLDIITGWGSHGIPPKIKPAVQEFLKSNKLTFSQPNQGMFRVVLIK